MEFLWMGADPGLVDTGLTAVKVDTMKRRIDVAWGSVNTASHRSCAEAAYATKSELDKLAHAVDPGSKRSDGMLWIEGFRDRGNVTRENAAMRELISHIKAQISGVVLDNMGVKKLITRQVLEQFGLWKVATTNHGDIQSAARIMLLGAARTDMGNQAIYQVLLASATGVPYDLNIHS